MLTQGEEGLATGRRDAEEAKRWGKIVKPYRRANARMSLVQLANSLLPYLACWALAAFLLPFSIWLAVIVAFIGCAFFMRIFIIFHDCGHYAFFQSRAANEAVGILTGIVTFFPFYKWRYEHAVHHATSSNLNARGIGDVWVLTVREYTELPTMAKLRYRVYRHPLILFGFGPLYLFVNARFNRRNASAKERWNTWLTNAVLAAATASLGSWLGWERFAIVQGTILYVSGVMGVWLFYVQHQFEGTYFEPQQSWSYFDAALSGSSFYQLPKVLQWVTGNIGFHHVHHLAPRIPNYHLEKVHQHLPPGRVAAVSLRRSLRALGYRLWDENKKTFVDFEALKKEQ